MITVGSLKPIEVLGIYPMDLSSVLPVLIAADLIISHIDNEFSNTIKVLDLCCSPGNYHNMARYIRGVHIILPC